MTAAGISVEQAHRADLLCCVAVPHTADSCVPRLDQEAGLEVELVEHEAKHLSEMVMQGVTGRLVVALSGARGAPSVDWTGASRGDSKHWTRDREVEAESASANRQDTHPARNRPLFCAQATGCCVCKRRA